MRLACCPVESDLNHYLAEQDRADMRDQAIASELDDMMREHDQRTYDGHLMDAGFDAAISPNGELFEALQDLTSIATEAEMATFGKKVFEFIKKGFEGIAEETVDNRAGEDGYDPD